MRTVKSFLNDCWLHYFPHKPDRQITLYSPIPGNYPGWYFWLKNGSGVMEMSFAEKTEEKVHFHLKFYPFPESKYFTQLSCGEQIVRLSPLFDDSYIENKSETPCCAGAALAICNLPHKIRKGIPHLHERANLHPTLFSLGKLIFTFKQTNLLKLTLESQNLIIQYSFEGITITDSQGQAHELVPPGEIDRKVPAWEICWHFVSILTHEVFPLNKHFIKKCLRKTSMGQVFYQWRGADLWQEKDPSVSLITHTFYLENKTGKEADNANRKERERL